MDDLELAIAGRDAIADWVETSLLVRGTSQLGLDGVQTMAREEARAGPAQINLAIDTMRRRRDLLGDRYPFEVVSDLAVRARADAVRSYYSAMVLMSPGSVARQSVISGSTSEMEVLFEKIAEQALRNLWGPGSQAVRFGYPSDHGRPQQFGPAIDWLAKLMGIPSGSGYRPPRRKDGGVDVVAWRPFPDGRSGFPVVLAQCTLQSELFSKSADVDVRIWSTWLALDFEPQTALAVPGIINQPTEWGQMALRSMILERMRLVHLLPVVAGSDIEEWMAVVISKLKPLMLAGQS